MLRLNLKNKPVWLDCGGGVRLELRPATSSIMADARRDPAVRKLIPAGADEESLGAMDEALQDELGVAVAKAVMRRCTISWEGVGDEDGNAIAKPFPEGIDALVDLPPIFDVLQGKFLGPAMLLVTEKNGSAPAPNGTSAAARNTARPARGAAKPARKSRTSR